MRRVIKRRAAVSETALPASLDPLLRRIYAAREIADAQALELGLEALQPPEALHNVDAAAALLATHLRAGNRILFVGDFDADGATSTAVGMRALHAMGARQIDFLVPNRFEFGYGLTPEIVALAREKRPDLIITVDNGISSLAGVRAAREAGIDVLVTDHHLPGADLPDATVIVNPNQSGDHFPSKALAGVGVIFYVMLALRKHLRDTVGFDGRAEPNLAELLDLVALGTVADVVPLDHNNRILVAQGLKRIRAGRCCAGIRALCQVAKRARTRLVAADLGFALGPRLNAAGRLDDMSLGIQCLLTDDFDAALGMAADLDGLNRMRRELEGQMQAEALQAVESMRLDRNLPVGLCLFDPDWHQGVVGLVASRIKERLHRPVIAFAPGDNGMLKGSARSIAGLHIRDALEAVATRHPGLISKFGGHAMAAGLSLRADDLEAFQAAFDTEARRWLDHDALTGVVLSDGGLAPAQFSLDTAEMLRDAGPWGQAFPEPVFDDVFEVAASRVVGESHLKLRLRHAAGNIDAIAFRMAEDWAGKLPSQARFAYKLDVNEYLGERKPQLVIEHIESAGRR